MLKKIDQIKTIQYCVNMMHFCNDASKIMIPNPDESESMQNICKGFSQIFSTLEKDFQTIAKMVMMGFSDKEIKTMLAKSKKDFKKHKQKDHVV